MKVSQLRDLTRKYAAGSISRDEYLAQRTRLIDGMVSGDIEILYRDISPPSANANRSSAAGRWYKSGSTLLLALLVLVLIVYFVVDQPQPTSATPSTGAPTVDPRGELFVEFLQNQDWAEPSLAKLESQWNEMSGFEQENVRRSNVYRRLKNATAQRIREQEALVAAGETEALLQVARLRDFSQRLGFEQTP